MNIDPLTQRVAGVVFAAAVSLGYLAMVGALVYRAVVLGDGAAQALVYAIAASILIMAAILIGPAFVLAVLTRIAGPGGTTIINSAPSLPGPPALTVNATVTPTANGTNGSPATQQKESTP